MNVSLLFASEEPNGKFLPGDINEFWFGLAAFLVVFGLLAWKVFPLLANMFRNRAAKVEEELSAADRAKAAADAEIAELRARVADAETEAAAIVADAESTAATLAVDLRAKADAEAASVRERGAAEIAAARERASADLQAELGVKALAAAEAVVRENLDDAAQAQLVEDYINRVGA